MIKKSLIIVFAILLIPSSFAFFWKKKEPCSLFLTSNDPRITINADETLKNEDVFKIGSRVYFLIYNPQGFKSDYIKYQIVKQDDNAHVGGYSRIRNITRRVNDKNYYVDYFVLNETGKYIIQVFDIENLHHWLVLGRFLVKDE
ncbi:MAG: hypothetical protein IKL52_07260 [Candidatus Gastranaerophilales bacterium]|nr:hypothetical protein [Candidatus Gastranaerophilales bacterium]